MGISSFSIALKNFNWKNYVNFPVQSYVSIIYENILYSLNIMGCSL